MRLVVIAMCLVMSAHHSFGQVEIDSLKFSEKKGAFSFYWGYNRSLFSKSDIHFTGPNYDFTLYDVKATDRPTELGWVYIKPTTLSIPQYVYRVEYFMDGGLNISGGLDHMKYVMIDEQDVTLSGVIDAEASDAYAGTYLYEEFRLTPYFVDFEHSDGLNYVSLDVSYLLNIPLPLDPRFRLGVNAGVGGFFMVTKTRVFVFSEGMDNRFHLAGYTMAAKVGPRFDFFDRFYFLLEARAGYATLPSVLIIGDAPNRADHNLSFFEYYAAFGTYFRLW
ncbi:MAG: hypothetical protein HN542_07900 [Flavobacteriales bacterium]|nr:hypothetical protein [Flavobacteriales bacterium]MBT3962719.1 hypothetical protein [Flavobacteriales bacterium]MBT4704316.1 hypothetical protein [Flavobacteriales bacterium]MBT4930528.1 hypothetical protein [Flavobacteriales bacterium]MBT6917183.1 hypothetical protein [Flavobacteriales bacterium]